MNQNRMQRFARLKALAENELALKQMKLMLLQKQLQQVLDEKDALQTIIASTSNPNSSENAFISMRQIGSEMLWKTQEKIRECETHAVTLNREIETARKAVIDDDTRVKTWERLIDNLQSKQLSLARSKESLIADDRFLANQTWRDV